MHSQRPGMTGSGVYLRALHSEALKRNFSSLALVGVPPDYQLEPWMRAVRFNSPELDFPVVGMSDVMPYASTRWSELSEAQLRSYRQAFSEVLHEVVQQWQPDILHCNHLWLLAALTRELFPERAVVASCHGTGLRQQRRLPELACRFRPWLQKLDRVFALTEAQKQEICTQVGLEPERVVVSGSGYDPEIFFPPTGEHELPASRLRVLYAGKLSEAKGLPWLLEAVAGTDLELNLAGSGEGPEARTIESRAAELGVGLLGMLSQDELAEQMRAHQVLVLPSFSEGLPLILVEALACACRVVVTELPTLQGWLPQALLDSGWVTTVKLPELSLDGTPLQLELPEFVADLRRALLAQQPARVARSEAVEALLRRCSWGGVFDVIAAAYPENR